MNNSNPNGAVDNVKRRFHSTQTSLTAFPRSKDDGLLLESQHLSVMFIADSLIRHDISAGILRLVIIVARITHSI